MKLKTLLFMLAFTFSLGVSAMVLQEEDPGTVYDAVFVSIASLVLAVPIIVEFLKDKLGLNGLVVQILSWVLGIALSFLGYFAGLGMFADMSILGTVLTGVGVGLVSNGVADTGIVEWLLTLIKFKKKSIE